jgi:exodeoxyribonuclease V alpha subunit
VGNEVVEEALDALCEYGDIVVTQIAGIEGCYLKHMFEAEQYTAARLLEMAGGASNVECRIKNVELGNDGYDRSLHEVVKGIESEQGIEYAEMQLEALGLAAKNGVLALTGGPGTGKTTTVRGILMLFDEFGLKTSLCAPTGRAAKRLSELCGREAATIHRLLGASLDENGMHMFDHDEDNPLSADAVIVDESSMIDILLMHALLKAMKSGCRLIMVGDADQLPPVGPGNMFLDVIRSGVMPVIALHEIFRQAGDSGIVKSAHKVNNGVMPDLAEKHPDFFFMHRQTEEQLAETVVELCSRRLPENMGISPAQIQVLSPTRKKTSGTVALNELLREKINPRSVSKKEKQYGDFVYRTGDKVMQIRNNYDILWESPDKRIKGSGIYNGDVGVIADIDSDRELVTVDFEDKLVAYTYDMLSELEPAFAMTVHKSQGSEYHAVVLAMTSAASVLLSRGVLYTAMTRAKSLLIIVGKPEVMEMMVKNDKRQKRYSGLRARLVGSVG